MTYRHFDSILNQLNHVNMFSMGRPRRADEFHGTIAVHCMAAVHCVGGGGTERQGVVVSALGPRHHRNGVVGTAVATCHGKKVVGKAVATCHGKKVVGRKAVARRGVVLVVVAKRWLWQGVAAGYGKDLVVARRSRKVVARSLHFVTLLLFPSSPRARSACQEAPGSRRTCQQRSQFVPQAQLRQGMHQ